MIYIIEDYKQTDKPRDNWIKAEYIKLFNLVCSCLSTTNKTLLQQSLTDSTIIDKNSKIFNQSNFYNLAKVFEVTPSNNGTIYYCNWDNFTVNEFNTNQTVNIVLSLACISTANKDSTFNIKSDIIEAIKTIYFTIVVNNIDPKFTLLDIHNIFIKNHGLYHELTHVYDYLTGKEDFSKRIEKHKAIPKYKDDEEQHLNNEFEFNAWWGECFYFIAHVIIPHLKQNLPDMYNKYLNNKNGAELFIQDYFEKPVTYNLSNPGFKQNISRYKSFYEKLNPDYKNVFIKNLQDCFDNKFESKPITKFRMLCEEIRNEMDRIS